MRIYFEYLSRRITLAYYKPEEGREGDRHNDGASSRSSPTSQHALSVSGRSSLGGEVKYC